MPGYLSEPVAIGEAPPIHESINAGLARHDSARADPIVSPQPTQEPPTAQPSATPTAPNRPLPKAAWSDEGSDLANVGAPLEVSATAKASDTASTELLAEEADVVELSADSPPIPEPIQEPEPELTEEEPESEPAKESESATEPEPEPAPEPTSELEPIPAEGPSASEDSETDDPEEFPPGNEPPPLPELEPPPLPEIEPPPLAAPEASTDPGGSSPPKQDPAIVRTAHFAEDPAMSHRESSGQPATRIAARVGNTVITLHDLEKAVRQRVQSQRRGQGQGQEQPPQPGRDELNQIALETLEFLIDRSIMVQAARRELTKPKQWEMFEEYVVKKWDDEELPTLMSRAGVPNSFEFERMLADRGESLAEIREEFILNMMAREFAGMKLHDKVSEPSLPEVYAHYRQNLRNYEQAAQVTWREIFLPIDAENAREDVQQLAQQLHHRLGQGEDFATLARQFSKSPKANEGGLWQTGFDSFSSEAVNQALSRLSPGQISPILEDPRGLYLIRVESVRAAGPRSFQEVQQSIKQALMSRHSEQAMSDFLNELYRAIPVSSPLFEGTETEPKQIRLGRELLAGGRSSKPSH